MYFVTKTITIGNISNLSGKLIQVGGKVYECKVGEVMV